MNRSEPSDLADQLDHHADWLAAHDRDTPEAFVADLRAAAVLLREQAEQLDTLRARDDDPSRPLADHERSRCTAGHVRQMAEEYDQMEAERDEARRQLDTLRNTMAAVASYPGTLALAPGDAGMAHCARVMARDLVDALAAAGGGVPEDGAHDV